MALLLWVRLVFLAVLAAVIVGYVWAGLGEPEE